MGWIADDILAHYGMPRRSGRYPWGSGEDPYQHSGDFLARIDTLKKSGWSETPEGIREAFGMSTTDYRKAKSNARIERRSYQVAKAKSMRDDGMTPTEIGREFGVNESTVRSWLDADSERRMNRSKETAKFLKDQVDKKTMIDVGVGVERELGVTRHNLDMAIDQLKQEGYHLYGGRLEQVTNRGKFTTLSVLAKPGVEHAEIYEPGKVQPVTDYKSNDGGLTFSKFEYPASLDSKRLAICYKEDGGINKDGVIELRRGCKDLSLGGSHYAQVRILVDGTHYLKGMAIYSDDLPKGVDVRFNTNKSKDTPKMEVLKKIKDDPDNPFGSLIKADGQSHYIGSDGKEHLSLINKRADEGDWGSWADKLPSQFLSKQPLNLAHRQLSLSLADKKTEYDDIMALTNPTIKKSMLKSFAEDCDAAAVNLKAAALPGQKYHVIIPVNELKDNEIFAPRYKDGTQLALVRYPHGGTFEIPVCTVNNRNPYARKVLGTDVKDAVGINARVAERLSGADFDGDTVMTIPTNYGNTKIKSTGQLKGLKDFDPKDSYGADEKRTDADGVTHYYRNGTEYKLMSEQYKQKQMGVVSNLITDMTLQGATPDELARAVRHSMVVIDAVKHHLDYSASEKENNIKALRDKYQSGGASTLISRAKGETDVLKRQGSPKTNIKGKPWYDPTRPEGALVYQTAQGDKLNYTVSKVNKRTGETVDVVKQRTQKSTKMAETDDARTLISEANTPMEREYAKYANALKDMANKARLAEASAGRIAYSPAAARTYSVEVATLKDKLNTALLNAPKERRAQVLASAEVAAKRQDNPDMTKEEIKKASQQALTKYRASVGAAREPISINEREWKAIQAGAVSETVLTQIINHADKDKLREYATPKAKTSVSQNKINKIRMMQAGNYTIDEIARACGVSPSTVSKYLKAA